MGWKKVKSIFLRYHGSFIASLIDNSPQAIEIARDLPDDNHLYSFDGKVGGYLTYSTKRMSPWTFTFQPKHVKSISEQFKKFEDCYLILVCGFETTAVLNKEEVSVLLPLNNPITSSITIRTGHDKKLAVSGTTGELKGKLSKTRTYERLLNSLIS
jgi:hypothetical protein